MHIKDNNEKQNKTTKNLLGPGAETRGGHGWLCSTIYSWRNYIQKLLYLQQTCFAMNESISTGGCRSFLFCFLNQIRVKNKNQTNTLLFYVVNVPFD